MGDGLAIKIKGPSSSECENPRSYFNRKQYFSVNLQAICDSKKRFKLASILCPGATHDATAWAASQFSSAIAVLEGMGFYIVGDDAYPPSEYMITPYSGSGLSEDKDNFNFYQSRLRINIECAFGML